MVMGCSNDKAKEAVNLTQKVSPQQMQGLWRSDGYHNLLEITDTDVRIFEVSDVHCLLVEEASIEEFVQEIPHLFSNKKRNRFATDPTLSAEAFHRYFYNRLADLPPSCIHGIVDETDDLLSNFSVFWNIFNEQYGFFELRSVNWQQQYENNIDAVNEAQTPEELFSIMQSMIEEFNNDGHVSIEAEEDDWQAEADGTGPSELENRVWEKFQTSIANENLTETYQNLLATAKYQDRPEEDKFSNLDDYVENRAIEYWVNSIDNAENVIQSYMVNDELTYAANEQLAWGTLKQHNIGYLNIAGLLEFVEISEEDELDLDEGTLTIDMLIQRASQAMSLGLDAAMTDLTNTDAIIIDIRLNNGGIDALGLEIAGRFFDKERLVFNKKARNTAGFTQSLQVSQAKTTATPYTKPIYLLTSSETLSAAETFALAMRSLPYVKFVGEPSFGNLSDPLSATLPNGWEIELSNEVYGSPSNESFEGIGIPLDIPVDMSKSFLTPEDPDTQKDMAIEAVITDMNL